MTHIYTHNLLSQDDPISKQPSKIITPLKPHQLTSLYKATLMEQEEYITYKNNNRVFKVSTNVGLLGDIVGYGKTLTALSIVANSQMENFKINDEYVKTYYSWKHNYNSMVVKSNFENIPENSNFLSSTLIIVPRGPVYLQWVDTLQKHTKLKFLAIDNIKTIKQIPKTHVQPLQTVKEFLNSYDIILVKNTNIKQLFDYCRHDTGFIRKWSRVMVDEFHDIIQTIPPFEYLFLWIISGTYNLISNRSLTNMSHVREIINNELPYILVKGNPEYVKQSFDIPKSVSLTYICRFCSTLSAIRSFLNNSVIERINASDISGAVREMGGTTASVETMVNILTTNIKKDIHNKKCELRLIESLQLTNTERETKISICNQQLQRLENQYNELFNRLTNVEKRICPICMDSVENPIVLECTHIYCCLCLVDWIKRKGNSTKCPECRQPINNNALISIDANTTSTPVQKMLTKEEHLINIINSKEGKFLVFTKLDNAFSGVKNILDRNSISYAEIKGTTACMKNILERFRNGELKVILLNTVYAGSGIDISFATDVILYHNMGEEATTQAVARAQRYGRTSQLTIHQLLYEHEKH